VSRDDPLRIEVKPERGLPSYLQIVQQVKLHVAAGRLRPGEQLPAVRELARRLNLNPSTVARAYGELERERVITTRRGGGSIVAARPDDRQLSSVRENRLAAVLGDSILQALSLGYEPEEIEAMFALQLARWREERRRPAELAEERLAAQPGQKIVFVGSHDLTIDLLASLLRQAFPDVALSVTISGSLGGLVSLGRGEAHVAGAHLLDVDTGDYNVPYVVHLLPGRNVVLITLAERIQGLMTAPGNPKGVQSLSDLARPDVVFVNRQPGSGTRVLLDHQLRSIGLSQSGVQGYDREEDTHLAVAAAVANGQADVGLGIYAAARAAGLDFVPLLKERYDLVTLQEWFDERPIQSMVQVINSDDFRNTVAAMGGYDVAKTGQVLHLP